VSSSVRIDKWLWAVRLYKTRTLAADACKAGHVLVDGRRVKPARDIHPGEVVQAKTGDITRIYRVLGLIERRVSAAAAREHAEDLTPPEELNKPRQPNYSRGIVRPRGAGRPTKKDRRALDALGEEPPAS
jgi:ribosome-associated heat shock protein Hsp15